MLTPSGVGAQDYPGPGGETCSNGWGDGGDNQVDDEGPRVLRRDDSVETLQEVPTLSIAKTEAYLVGTLRVNFEIFLQRYGWCRNAGG